MQVYLVVTQGVVILFLLFGKFVVILFMFEDDSHILSGPLEV
jgi:hypothetical protein